MKTRSKNISLRHHISSYTLLLKHSISSKKVGLHTRTHHYLQHFATGTQKANIYYLDITCFFFAMLLKHLSSPRKKYLHIPCHPTRIFHMQSIPHSNKTKNIKWHRSQTQKSKQYFFYKKANEKQKDN